MQKLRLVLGSKCMPCTCWWCDAVLAAGIRGGETRFQFLRAEVIRLGTDALLLPSILLGTNTASFLVSLNETV